MYSYVHTCMIRVHKITTRELSAEYSTILHTISYVHSIEGTRIMEFAQQNLELVVVTSYVYYGYIWN